jgi:hypothetical protein
MAVICSFLDIQAHELKQPLNLINIMCHSIIKSIQKNILQLEDADKEFVQIKIRLEILFLKYSDDKNVYF